MWIKKWRSESALGVSTMWNEKKKTLNSDSHSSVIKKLTIREQFTIWPHSNNNIYEKRKTQTTNRQQTK